MEYLNAEDFGRYVDISNKEKKIVVVTDPCGSGKSESMLKFIASNMKLAPRIVVEKISTCNRIKKELIRLGIPEPAIGIYNSSKTSDDIQELYICGVTKTISIITHERLNMDPLVNWLTTDTYIQENPSLIIVDEVINNMTKLITITRAPLLGTIQEYYPGIYQPIKDALDGKKVLTMEEAIDLLIYSADEIRAYAKKTISYKVGVGAAGFLTNHSHMSLANIELNYLTKSALKDKSIVKFQRYTSSMRVSYQFILTYLAILTGRFESNDGLTVCAIISPLYSWNAIKGVPVVLLDATGEYNFYPDDLCKIIKPTITLLPKLVILHHIQGISADKREYEAETKREYKLLSHRMNGQFKKLLNSIYCKDDILYICTWKDKPGYLQCESLIQEICKKLKLYTNRDKEKELVDSSFLPETNNYIDLSDELEKNIKVYISHFGMSRGENRYAHCNKVLIIGDYYLPYEIYQRYEKLIQQPITEYDVSKSVFGISLQEIYRSRVRKGLPVEVYMISSNDVITSAKSILDLVSCDTEDYNDHKDSSGYALLSDLTSAQLDKLLALQDRFPGFFYHEIIEINIADLVQLWETRKDNIHRDLERISNKADLVFSIENNLVTLSLTEPTSLVIL